MTESSEPSFSQLPNPFTHMAFLPPEIAHQMEVRIYILVGVLGILAWDILTHLSEDYKLLVRYRSSTSNIVYHLSRWSALAYLALCTMFDTAQFTNCDKIGTALCAIYHPAVALTSLLFFFRVRVIYDKNKWITLIFLVMWLVIAGMTATFITRPRGAHIGNTKYCMYTGFQPYLGLSNITIAVFDTCVFVAISWYILITGVRPTDNDESPRRFRTTFGRYLPKFSRAIFRDGQKYYMVAMICNLLVLIMSYARGVPDVYRPLFPVIAVGLTNIVACRVFRHTKLGHYDRPGMTSILGAMSTPSKYNSMVFASIHDQSMVHTINIHASSGGNTEVPPTGSSVEKLTPAGKEVPALAV